MVDAATRAPGKGLLLLELRALPELAHFVFSWPTLATLCPRGDGQPVLVLPGLLTSDKATAPLRSLLRSLGYPTYGWELGRNNGPLPGVEEGLMRRLADIAETHGRKVSLVGWSLGGIYARQMAKMAPDLVRQVISLGSPFRGDPRVTNAWRVYQLASGDFIGDANRHMGGAIETAPRVPTTAIYSRTDGVCHWRNCIEKDAPNTENIEVKASHCGLGHHPAAAYAITDRLAAKEGAWKRFERTGVRALVFPRPRFAN